MCPFEPGWCEATLPCHPEGVDTARSSGFGDSACCPKCGTRFRLVRDGSGGSADGDGAPDWSPRVSTIASALPAATVCDCPESIGVAIATTAIDYGDPAVVQRLPKVGAPSDLVMGWQDSDREDSDGEDSCGEATTRIRRRTDAPIVPAEGWDDLDYELADIDALLEWPIQLDLQTPDGGEGTRDNQRPSEPGLVDPIGGAAVGTEAKPRSLRPSAPAAAAQENFLAVLAQVDPWNRLAASAEAANQDLGTNDAPRPEGTTGNLSCAPSLTTAPESGCAVSVVGLAGSRSSVRWARGRVGIGVGVAVLGGILLVTPSETRTRDPDVRVPSPALAVDVVPPLPSPPWHDWFGTADSSTVTAAESQSREDTASTPFQLEPQSQLQLQPESAMQPSPEH